MVHADHEPGTREDCDERRALAYEPGWYRAMRDERVVARDPMLVDVPEPGEAEVNVVVAEAPTEPSRQHR